MNRTEQIVNLDKVKFLIGKGHDFFIDRFEEDNENGEEVYTKEFLDSPRDSQWGNTQRDQKLGLEFNLEEYKEIDKYCKEKKIQWYASAWDIKSQIFLRQFNCNYNKVASAMIVDKDLLRTIAEEKKYTFISTGMSTYKNIDDAIEIFNSYGCPFSLMHTVSTYPMKDEEANLSLITKLKNKYQCDVGYSGHEVGLAISYAAASMGISSLERHITLDRSMYGSDQAASLEPSGLKQLIGGIKKIENAIGDGVKKITDSELPVALKLREHLNWKS